MTRTGLRADVEALLVAAGCDGWGWAHPLGAESAGVGVGEDTVVSISSMYKTHLLAAFCLASDRGLLDPGERITVAPTDGPGGTPGIATLSDPLTLSLRDLARQMMALSDSVAARVLHRLLPEGALAEVLRRAGLSATTIVAPGTSEGELPPLPDDGSAATEAIRLLVTYPNVANDPAAYRSVSSPRELCRLLDWLWSGRELSETARDFARTVLGQQVYRHRIPSGFPAEGVGFQGKTGTIGPVRGEMSVVTIEGETPIVVSVITRSARGGANLAAADITVGRVARRLVDEIRYR